jgi:hypothetical protein
MLQQGDDLFALLGDLSSDSEKSDTLNASQNLDSEAHALIMEDFESRLSDISKLLCSPDTNRASLGIQTLNEFLGGNGLIFKNNDYTLSKLLTKLCVMFLI